ncbi:MAG: hypothetical protein FJ245_00310 [Nitrospira sp.]|nr:hypothetical protein [Nitrospira sp.]
MDQGQPEQEVIQWKSDRAQEGRLMAKRQEGMVRRRRSEEARSRNGYICGGFVLYRPFGGGCFIDLEEGILNQIGGKAERHRHGKPGHCSQSSRPSGIPHRQAS